MPSAAANRLVIALAQIPAIVGDIAGNRDRLRKARKEAAGVRGGYRDGAQELYLSGYPPRGGGPGAEARVSGGLPRGRATSLRA